MPRRAALPFLVLFAGVLIASTASIMVRYAQEAGMPSLSIAAGRLGLATLILTPIALTRARAELRGLSRRDLLFALGSGAFLAVHFASWISSLAYTSVASSVALVSTNPIWVGLASLLIFQERMGWRVWLGIVITLVGTLIIGISDMGSSQPNPLLGNALALLGSITVSAYLLIGRDLRRRLSVLAYIYVVYSTAAVILLLWAILSGQQILGFPPSVYLLLLGLAVGPQLLGHTSFNYALSALSATFVAVAILGEPIGSALLAIVILGETVAPNQLIGIVLLLAGIVLASLGERGTEGQGDGGTGR